MILQGERVWIGGQFTKARITVENGMITRIDRYEKDDARAVDCKRNRLVPGFLDIHTHGAYGVDTNDGDAEGLSRWAAGILWEGVTSFLPTAAVQEREGLKRALSSVAQAARKQEKTGSSGREAQILGIHLEGPCLSPDFGGAQEKGQIRSLAAEEFLRLQDAAEGRIRRITLAPEADEDFRLTRLCSGSGVSVSMGHSGADYEQVLLAAANGASCVTHVYNGMDRFHHRRPGIVGAALGISDLYGEIICDGLHCHPAALNLFFQAKGRHFGIMVTDSLSVKGCKPGAEGRLGEQAVVLGGDGLARLKDSTVIAGSTLAMNQGLKFLVEEAGVPFDAALNSCTLNPARYLGLESRKGRIAAGCDGDLVLLGEDYQVLRVWRGGVEGEIIRNRLSL